MDIAGPDAITFLANPKYTPQLNETKAGAIFLGSSTELEREDIAVIRAKDPYAAYARTLRLFHPQAPANAGIHASAVVAESAQVSETAEIGANVVIGEDCTVGDGTIIFPNVTLYDGVSVGKNCIVHSNVSIRENCVVGDNCIIHNNSTIGSDGFGFAKSEDNSWIKIPQTGRVVLEDDVEVGANTSIDCASVGETRIKRGAKLDNLVQIGHSCTVGEDTLVCSQTGLAGSSVIGDRVILAGQVGIAGHLKVGNDVVITAKSGTSHDVADGTIISGIPAFDNRDWLRSTAAFRKLGQLSQTISGNSKTTHRSRREIMERKEKIILGSCICCDRGGRDNAFRRCGIGADLCRCQPSHWPCSR